MPIIAQYLKDKDNNFNLLRFIAASTVVYQHCYPLLGYSEDSDYFVAIINPLAVFFIISGFLISRSWTNSKSLIDYSKKRFLRIVPGLFICLLLTIFVIGPLCTSLSLSEYFSQKSTYRYLLKNLIFNTSFRITGLFENNPFKQGVNGSLWSLEPEVFCYFIVAVFGLLYRKTIFSKFNNIAKFRSPNISTAIMILLIATLIIILQYFSTIEALIAKYQIQKYLPKMFKYQSHLNMIIYFAIGSLYHKCQNHIKLNGKVAIFLLLSYLINQKFYQNLYVNYLILPYLTLYFALACKFNNKYKFGKISLRNFGTKHDLSYGIYIYSFPIQQTIIHFLLTSQIIKPFLSNFAPELVKINLASEQNFNIILFAFLFFISYSVSLIFAFLSFKYVEKPCLGIYKT